MKKRILWSITRNEAKLLRRDWSFRYLTAILIGGAVVLQTWIQTDTWQPAPWASVALPSSIPYANAYLIYFVQLFFALFLAGRFLFEKRSSSTMDSIRVRPYSNSEQWWGQALAFGGTMLLVDTVLIGMALLIHLFISEASFSWWPYLFYFFTLTLPTLVFFTGVSLLVKSVLRHQASSIVVLGVLFYLDIVYAPRFLHGTLDVLSSTLPNALSEWTGFSGLGDYLWQRGAFLFAGIGMLCLGVRFLHRPDDHPSFARNPLIWGGACLLTAGIFGSNYYHSLEHQQAERATARALFVKYENHLKAEVTDHHICFQQTGKTFTAESRLTLTNPYDEVLKPVVLYLNPGLEVKQITSGNNHPLRFHREGQILLLDETLSAGDSLKVQLDYAGGLTPSVCYSEYATLPDTRHYSFFRYGQELFFLEDHFTLLTPEVLWYPTSQPTVHVQSPHTTPKTFTRFTLEVIEKEEKTVISQGTPAQVGDTLRFTNRYPLTGLSLCIGRDYVHYADTLNGVNAELYIFKGHEWYCNEVKDVNRLKKDIAQRIQGYSYPFDKLALVEVPIHFAWYARSWTKQVEALQPELLFRPEREAMGVFSPAYDSVQYKYGPSYSIVNGEKVFHLDPNPERTWVTNYISRFLGFSQRIYKSNLFAEKLGANIHTIDRNNTNLLTLKALPQPQFYSHHFNRIDFVINQLPRIIANMYQRAETVGLPPDGTRPDKVDYFQHHSLREFLQTSSDKERFVQGKVKELAKRLHALSVFEELEDFIHKYKKEHYYEHIRFETFCEEWHKEHEVDLLPIFREWYDEQGIPCYSIRDLQHYLVRDEEDRKHVLTTFKIWNRSDHDGYILIQLGRMYRGIHTIPANSKKVIRTLSPLGDRMFSKVYYIHTGLSSNFPEIYEYHVSEVLPEGKWLPIGIFDADEQDFAPNPKEFLVENNGKGFSITQSNKTTLKELVQEERKKRMTKNQGDHPRTWTEFLHEEAHGDTTRTYHVKLWEKGGKDIEWKVDLPTDGEYELFVYTNYKFYENIWNPMFSLSRSSEEWARIREYSARAKKNPFTQFYVFTHEGGQEEVAIEMDRSGNGWVSLGKFRFPKGTAKLTLLDKGTYTGQYLYADAVKWVQK